jgi:hypothetical protein
MEIQWRRLQQAHMSESIAPWYWRDIGFGTACHLFLRNARDPGSKAF